MRYKEFNNVKTFIISEKIQQVLLYKLKQISNDYDIVDVKFSTAFNAGLKHFEYSALIFAQQKENN